MKLTGPYGSQPHETRQAILRCAEHGVATSRTLTQMVYSHARKSTAGNPAFVGDASRLQFNSARKRVARLVAGRVFNRTVLLLPPYMRPVASVLPNRAHQFIEPLAAPSGQHQHALTRSTVAGALSERGYVIGREPELVELFFGPALGQCAYHCVSCGKERTLERHACTQGLCALRPRMHSGTTAFDIEWDVAFKANGDAVTRCVVWVDDGTSLSEQFKRLLPLLTLAGASLKVIPRADDDSVYSALGKAWVTRGERLQRMLAMIAKAGATATAGGDYGHPHRV